ncbi:MAG: signal peptidase I [Clostridiaceae bacterium]|nr:signal peptidase I [Clostridiaceae bacterium]
MRSAKKIWRILTNILVILVVVLAIALVGVRLFGLQVFAVTSGSMEPAYQVGSLIYVKKVEPAELAVGDPITFLLDEKTVATHRIVEVVPDESDPSVLRYRTKGDANNTVDGGLVHYRNVIGRPVFSIPKLGYVSNFIQKPPGSYIAIAAAAILILLTFLPDILGDEEKKGQKDANKV